MGAEKSSWSPTSVTLSRSPVRAESAAGLCQRQQLAQPGCASSVLTRGVAREESVPGDCPNERQQGEETAISG